jgi:murein DD-endopeptidase MepM/ murein hydrolase activator NlpD
MPAAPRVSQGFSPAHPALDYALPCGSPLGAPFAGRVLAAIPSPVSYGFHLWIQSAEQPNLGALIAHMQAGSFLVRAGDQVERGQPIGRSGNTGHVAGGGRNYLRGGPPGVGCHVHYGIRRSATATPAGMIGGTWVEPSAWVGGLFAPSDAPTQPQRPAAGQPGLQPVGLLDVPAQVAGFVVFRIPQYLKIAAGGTLALAGLVVVMVTAGAPVASGVRRSPVGRLANRIRANAGGEAE